MTYNTGNPIGSNDPRDLADNAQALDRAINDPALSFTDRLGQQRMTLSGMEQAASGNTAIQATIEAKAAQVAAELARDAAFIQAGVYDTTTAGLAAVPFNSYFKVIGSDAVAVNEYKKIVGKNMFDTANVRDGFYVNSVSGAIGIAAGWGCSAFIPVTAGKTYTLSGVVSRAGLAYFSAANDSAVIPGSLNTSSTFPLTTTAPAGATHVVFNLYTAATGPVYSNVQFEEGAAATAYSPYGAAVAKLVASYPSASLVSGLEPRVSSIEAGLTYYQDIGAGLASVPMNARFKVSGSGAVAAYEYQKVASYNLFNTSTIQAGYYLASTGAGTIVGAAGWGCSAFIPVTAGKTYTLSGTRGRYGLQFYSAANAANAIAGSYNESSAMPLTVIAPAGATHVVFNLYSSSNGAYSNIQFEEGAVATPYAAYGATTARPVATYAGPNDAALVSSAKLVLNGDGSQASYIQVKRDGKNIKRSVIPWPSVSLTASHVMNFTSDEIDGVVIRSTNDDPAPYRTMGTTIGANHGYVMTKITANGHGKTASDVGSVYSNGGAQYVLVGIVDANNVYITARTSNNATPTGTLSYVSGGVSTTSITGTAAAAAQMYPPNNNRQLRVFVDGVESQSHTATIPYANNVQFVETYDVLEKNTVVEWFVATGGVGLIPVGDPAFSVSISYVFDYEGQCTIYSDFVARKTIALQDIMFVMGVKMNATDGEVRYYVPKSLPLTHEGVNYSYSLIDSADTTAWATRLDFTPARCEPTGILCDRVVQLSNNYGFALGYLPVQSASIANRRINATVKALQISNAAAKVYMSAIDKGAITLNAGDYFSTIAYRNIVLRDPARTSLYAVRTNSEDYLYVDWHADVIDRVPVPPDFIGRSFEVVEKSSNVTVMSQALTSNLIVSVNAAGSYGYLIVKVI